MAKRTVLRPFKTVVGDQAPPGQCNEKFLANKRKLTVEAMFDRVLHTDWAHIQNAHLWENSLWTP
eukprot:11115694-Ditylum_brightwellii.AAC.1